MKKWLKYIITDVLSDVNDWTSQKTALAIIVNLLYINVLQLKSQVELDREGKVSFNVSDAPAKDSRSLRLHSFGKGGFKTGNDFSFQETAVEEVKRIVYEEIPEDQPLLVYQEKGQQLYRWEVCYEVFAYVLNEHCQSFVDFCEVS